MHERLAMVTEILRLSDPAGDREMEAQARAWRCGDLLESGDVAGFDRALDAYLRLAAALRQPVWSWYAGMLSANRALLRGDFDEAERQAAAALEAGQPVMVYGAPVCFACQRWAIQMWRGSGVESAAVLRPLAEAHPALGARCTLVEIATALADALAARRWFDEIAANDFADLRRDTIWVHAVCQLAAGCAFLGDTSRASALYELLRPYAKRWAVWAEAICYGPVDHYLGLLAHTLSRWDESAAHFESALTATAAVAARPLQARTQIEYARLLLEYSAPATANGRRRYWKLRSPARASSACRSSPIAPWP